MPRIDCASRARRGGVCPTRVGSHRSVGGYGARVFGRGTRQLRCRVRRCSRPPERFVGTDPDRREQGACVIRPANPASAHGNDGTIEVVSISSRSRSSRPSPSGPRVWRAAGAAAHEVAVRARSVRDGGRVRCVVGSRRWRGTRRAGDTREFVMVRARSPRVRASALTIAGRDGTSWQTRREVDCDDRRHRRGRREP